jgi:HAD superfamily phosphatase (TIGR01668 family)
MKKKNIKYLPNLYFNSFFSIPYDYFSKKGIKVLFFDLDNTLLSPNEKELSIETKNQLKEIKKKFKIIIISNSSYKRINKVLGSDFNYILLKWFQKKPSNYGFIKALELFNIKNDQAIMIGDQLRTDILGANKMKIFSILVKPINKSSECFLTKLNRLIFEYPYISYIKKKYPKIYTEKFKNFLE